LRRRADNEALDVLVLRDGEDLLEERVRNAAIAVIRPDRDVLDLDMRYLRRDDLNRLVAPHSRNDAYASRLRGLKLP
jgi:hypothetical protein